MGFKEWKVWLGGLAVVLALMVACEQTTPQADTEAMGTAAAATLTALAPTSDVEAVIATAVQATLQAQAMGATTPAPAASPTPQVSPSSSVEANLAAYVWTYVEDNQQLVLYDAQGQVVWNVSLPQYFPDAQLHTADPVAPGQTGKVRLVYHGNQVQGDEVLDVLMVYANGQSQVMTVLGSTQQTTLTALTGPRALPRVAYGAVTISDYQYHSALYVNSLDFTPTEPLFTASTDDGRVLHPLSMESSGVWFTYAYFGAPMGPVGLYHVDYAGQVLEALPQDRRIVGFDGAVGWVAYTAAPTQGAPGLSLTWRPVEMGNLLAPSPQAVTLEDPLASGPDVFGVMSAAFSDHYIAWSLMVGSPMDAQYLLRVFTLSGESVVVEPPEGLSVLKDYRYVSPLTWLRNAQGQDVLVLGARTADTEQPVVLLVPPDVSTILAVLPGEYQGRAWAKP